MTKPGVLRPMTVADLPHVGALFYRVFRGRKFAFSENFSGYLHDLLFTNPAYTEELGSLVHQRDDGRVDSAIFSVPMTFRVGDRPIRGQMLCAFMADRTLGKAGAMEIALKLRPRRQELVFSDSASPTSKAHLDAVRGTLVPLQGLAWRRSFRPFALTARRLQRHLPLFSLPLSAFARVAGPLDTLMRKVRDRYVAPTPAGVTCAPMTEDEFVRLAPGFVERYAVRPEWSEGELRWILAMASGNERLGPLQIRSVSDRTGKIIGCFVYFGGPGEIARVLNVLADERKEAKVVAGMFRHFDEIGCVGAVGRTQAALVEGLTQQRALMFRHEAFVGLNTRHPEIVEAARRNDIYIGGLAGEGWSRLMWDFRR